jgi:hypothetical protein
MAQPAIAAAMGVSLSTVNRAHMAYDHGGIKAKPALCDRRMRHTRFRLLQFATLPICAVQADGGDTAYDERAQEAPTLHFLPAHRYEQGARLGRLAKEPYSEKHAFLFVAFSGRISNAYRVQKTKNIRRHTKPKTARGL